MRPRTNVAGTRCGSWSPPWPSEGSSSSRCSRTWRGPVDHDRDRADAAAVSRHGHSDLIRALKSVLAAAPRTPVGASAMVAADMMNEPAQALGGEYHRAVIRRHRLVVSIVALGLLLTLGFAVPSGTSPPPVLPVHRIVIPPQQLAPCPQSSSAVDASAAYDDSHVVDTLATTT